ncbi:hydrogenase expression/formation protein [Bradyrhizobium sediminis]|uniref:Hydrogenase expression/formation protein n=1 Tax=Bradyrhizobium sediminis TaxID=2840469 RepID=A0A975RPA5_9BRAD|nr:hydrogenase expression/formation protein [Bradyrhizobium sediminis]QWG14593.1 hydrogenase expression/formation protein [Bradyrhizobium sediminis]
MSGINMGIVGPGTQPADADGAELAYMEMPKAMRTYAMPAVPEPDEVEDIDSALALLAEVRDTLAEGKSASFDLGGLDRQNRAFVDQVLGDGEVSIVAGSTIQAQESVLAGVWRVHELDEVGRLQRDTIEVGGFPRCVLLSAQDVTAPALRSHDGPLPAMVYNAPALVTEMTDKLAAWRPGVDAHVINLSLLPLSDEDVSYLDARLGPGSVTILSRGYGNCRISSTATRNGWYVRYFNSREAVILNTIEITEIPSVACAAPEDLEDSAQRLSEILDVYQ